MRDIADKFVGGIERIDADEPASRPGVTLRAVVIGLAGVAALSIIEPYNQNIFQNTMLIGNHLPVAVLFTTMMLVLVVNPVLAVLPRNRSLFSPARLLVVWMCLLPASLWMWRGPVDPSMRDEAIQGLTGLAVGAVWGLTGAVLAASAIVARYRGTRSQGRGGSIETLLLVGLLWAVALTPPPLRRELPA